MPAASSSRFAQRDAHPNGERCEAILCAATSVFAKRGYRNTDVQVIADALKLGKGTIYRKYGSKRELFLAAVDRAMWLLHDAVQEAAKNEADPLDQIASAIRTYLDFFAEHPDYVELLIQERAEFRDRAKPTYFLHRDANIAPWKQMFQDLIAAGRVREIAVDRIIDVMSGLVYGTMFINFFSGRKKSSAAQADEILEVVFHGLLTRQEQDKQGHRQT